MHFIEALKLLAEVPFDVLAIGKYVVMSKNIVLSFPVLISLLSHELYKDSVAYDV